MGYMNDGELEEENKFDGLTKIYNRQGFYKYTEQLLKEYPDISFCLIYWNIRKFKVVNDLFGREAGDKVLIYLANSLKEEFGKEKATYGRLERDNFICCVPEEIIQKGKWLRLGEINYAAEGSEYHFYNRKYFFFTFSPQTLRHLARSLLQSCRSSERLFTSVPQGISLVQLLNPHSHCITVSVKYLLGIPGF